jgi:undecaprenyl phosphate-alpha-L-ara4N flippase subunit ArnE
MSLNQLAFLVVGALAAAVGQASLKIGATGCKAFVEYLNSWILLGLGCYIFGTFIWIYCLSRLPLTVVYPFTALTFVLVYGIGIFIFGEHVRPIGIIGMALILTGLGLVIYQ